MVLWNIEKYQDRILVNKNTEPVESRSMTANMVRHRQILYIILFVVSATLAQSAERQSHNLKVVSSSLTGGIIFLLLFFLFIIFVQAIFDTDPKLDHAPMVQHCVIASIKEGHSRDISNIQWIPHNIEICQKTGGVLDNPSHECNQIISCSIDGYVLMYYMLLISVRCVSIDGK